MTGSPARESTREGGFRKVRPCRWTSHDLTSVPAALRRRSVVRVDASAALAARVTRRKQRKGVRVNPAGNVIEAADMKEPGEIPGLPEALVVRPIEILHAAGRLTAGTNGPLSPVSGLWPVVRYAWIFAPSSEYLHLTPDALALRARLRSALSETLGIGLSSMLARVAIRAERGDCSIEIADAEMAVGEEALKAGGQRVSVRQRGSVCPDYVATAHDGLGGVLGFDTIESKGLFDAVRTGPSAAALNQLRDATVQTEGLQVADRILSGYGFCACVADRDESQHWGPTLRNLSRGEVFVLGVDPREREAPIPQGEAPVLRRPGGAWAVTNRERFARSAFDATRAQILLWAGDEQVAREILREPPPERLGPPNVLGGELQDDRGRFEGVELQIGAGGAGPALRIFTGVEETILAAARTGEMAQLRTQRRRRRERQQHRADGFEDTDEDDDTIAVSIDEDATRLEVRLIDA